MQCFSGMAAWPGNAISAFVPSCPALSRSTFTNTENRIPTDYFSTRTRNNSVLSSQRRAVRTGTIFCTAANGNSASNIPVPFAPPVSDTWELDFYSRPVLGMDGKKLWELVIVDLTGNFEYVETIPNTLVNSRELRKRIETAMSQASKKPATIRFFRTQMINMIQIALSELDVTVIPTRKTYMLYRVLKQRLDTVYCQMPGFKSSLATMATLINSSASSTSSLGTMGFSNARRLPDLLRCEKFAFGNFPLGYLIQFFQQANPEEFFGDSCIVDGGADSGDAQSLDPNLTIPGLIAFSKRAPALAAWINGIELVFIKGVVGRREVVFESGLNNAYRFAQITDDIKDDVRTFEKLKGEAKGLHFLAIQASPESEEIEGLWLMNEI